MRFFFTPRHASWLVVGLGNPGLEYADTRHNVGFRVIERLASKPWKKWYTRIGDVVYCTPMTYMNLSGDAVAPLARKYKVPADHIIVVHDELDLPEGKLKVRMGGNENGHNGLKSISARLGTRDYIRVRVGIGRPARGESIADWVLGVGGSTDGAPEAVRAIIDEGFAKAQSHINARK